MPSGETARRRRGPKAEVPKVLSGSSVARSVWGFCRTRVPAATVSVVWRESSALAISIWPVRGKGVGELEGEGELLVDGEVVVVGEMDGGVGGLADALAEEGDGGTRRGDGDGEGEGAAVFEGEVGGELVAVRGVWEPVCWGAG